MEMQMIQDLFIFISTLDTFPLHISISIWQITNLVSSNIRKYVLDANTETQEQQTEWLQFLLPMLKKNI